MNPATPKSERQPSTSFRKTVTGGSPRKGKPALRKLGTIDCDIVETTPIVFKGRLYRFEYVRTSKVVPRGYEGNKTGDSYFRFVDVETGDPTPSFAAGYHLGSAFVHAGTVYAYGVSKWGASGIQVFWSGDMKEWKSQMASDVPRWKIYNTSVCGGQDGRYIMAIEIGEPPEEVGVPFTIRFAESEDLLNWKLTPADCVFSKDRYTACPTLRFVDGQYYMIYLEEKPGPTYESYIVRSKDLIHWESSPFNPVLKAGDNDKLIANPRLTPEQRERIAGTVNVNNSDIDLCEFKGKTFIYYSWGNQQGIEFLGEALHNGSLRSFFKGFFPD